MQKCFSTLLKSIEIMLIQINTQITELILENKGMQYACGITKKGQESPGKRPQLWIFTPHFPNFWAFRMLHPI